MSLINSIVEILGAFIYYNVSIFWRFVVWVVSLITLPARAVAALRREKQLQAQVSELQDRLDFLIWDRKELESHIGIAIKEHEMMEMVLSEVEEEHSEAIHKIKLLESALHDLKDQNHHRLKEVHGKSQWDIIDTQVVYHDQKHKYSNTDDGLASSFTMMHNKNGGNHDCVIMDKSGDVYSVAVSQSMFSAMLCVVVGLVVWEAQEACMPLVMGLCVVVGMSLRSVVRFFMNVKKNKPASDAVVLLSLNWFIIGTLAYPTLPRLVQLLAPFFNDVQWSVFKFY